MEIKVEETKSWLVDPLTDSQLSKLQSDIERFESKPNTAKISVFLPERSKKEDKEALTPMVRQLIESSVGIRHQPESSYDLEVYLTKKQPQEKNTEEDNEVVLYKLNQIKYTRQPLMLSGYYLKRSRTLSQTPMFVDGRKRRVGTNSVEEILSQVLTPYFYRKNDNKGNNAFGEDVKKMIFASAGREDVDVQVFGKGRMMLLSFPEPTRNADSPASEFLKDLENEISLVSNDTVRVRGLRLATNEDKKFVLEGAEQRRKMYVCVVELESPVEDLSSIENLKDLVIKQKTPIRVSHRRAMMVRERMVHRTVVARVSPTIFVLRVDAGAGFYIKEFVHGDLGRTSPSISEMLGVNARLVTLDFLGCVEEDSGVSIDTISSEDFW